jgi:hypothetical protein
MFRSSTRPHPHAHSVHNRTIGNLTDSQAVATRSRVADRPLCDISGARRAPFAHVPPGTATLDLSSEKTIINACS